MPTMQIERLPQRRHRQRPRAGRAARLPRADRRRRARRRAGAGRQHRHRRAVDTQPVRVIHGAVVPRLPTRPGPLPRRPRRCSPVSVRDGANHARLVVAAAEGRRVRRRRGRVVRRPAATGRDARSRRAVHAARARRAARGSTTTAGSPMRGSPVTGGLDGSRVRPSASATAVAGWVPLDNPLAFANRVIPDDPRRHGEVLDTLGRRLARRLAPAARRAAGRHGDRREDGAAGRSDDARGRGSPTSGPPALAPVAAGFARRHDQHPRSRRPRAARPGRCVRCARHRRRRCRRVAGCRAARRRDGPGSAVGDHPDHAEGQGRRSGHRCSALRARLRRGRRGRPAGRRCR